jgi:hypothetical protein
MLLQGTRSLIAIGAVLSALATTSSGVALDAPELGRNDEAASPGPELSRGIDPSALAALRLEPGDLIFRSGMAFESQMVKTLDRETSYSHVGVIDDDRVPHVIHIVPGSGDSDVVRREPLTDFLVSDAANAFAVFRVRPEHRIQARSANEAAREFFERRLHFDSRFSLDSVDDLYCSELVWRAYLAGGLDLLEGRTESSFTGRIILLSALQSSRLVTRVY